MSAISVGYVNVFVRDFDRAVDFYSNTLGLQLDMRADDFGYASFQAGPISFAVAKADDPALVGKHTGIGFIVDDIDAVYADLIAKGVESEMPPTKQPWGGILALMKDPDGNVFYLDPGIS
ncbi:MAG: VOC family protein [Pseudomonadales bacterium]|nr:VOC family protein [Pseudomonadales bacterium]MDP7358096.1 VOC family protein [Pseudomonadales bacterium]HJN49485.1 VOC family protein [Pseudomonadales bacterium]